jgi:hypothetical protein
MKMKVVETKLQVPLTSVLHGREWSALGSSRFIPGEKLLYSAYRRLVVVAKRKIAASLQFEPRSSSLFLLILAPQPDT